MEKFKQILKKGTIMGKIVFASFTPTGAIEHAGNPEKLDPSRTIRSEESAIAHKEKPENVHEVKF